MVTRGYFAYRYEMYYRQYLRWDAYPVTPGKGQYFLDMIPRDPSHLPAWIDYIIKMLEEAETFERADFEDSHLGYQETCDNDWVFVDGIGSIDWTYVIDLDNLTFTINGYDHWRLDSLPEDLSVYYGSEDLKHDIPDEVLYVKVDLWPAPNFDVDDCQRRYEDMHPVVVPAAEWGAPTWDKLSMSQRFSIEITHHLLHETSLTFTEAYVPYIRAKVGAFCWNILCASAPALPIFQDNDFEKFNLSPRTLYSGFNNDRTRPACQNMRSLRTGNPFKLDDRDSTEYFWVRGCLVTFCARLAEHIYVALEVEQMARKLRRSGPSASLGIILSSQQELVVVALDGLKVRHSPVLDIRATDKVPGRASDGRLLLTYLLNPSSYVVSLPWRTPQLRQLLPQTSRSIAAFPPELLRMIIHYADIGTYLTLCRVSRSIRSVCLANPRVGDCTVLHKVPGFDLIFVVRGMNGNAEKTIKLRWRNIQSGYYFDHGKWQFREVLPEELAKLKREQNLV